MAAGACCHSPVLFSRSVNRNVRRGVMDAAYLARRGTLSAIRGLGRLYCRPKKTTLLRQAGGLRQDLRERLSRPGNTAS
jgi:hypothetical protein